MVTVGMSRWKNRLWNAPTVSSGLKSKQALILHQGSPTHFWSLLASIFAQCCVRNKTKIKWYLYAGRPYHSVLCCCSQSDAFWPGKCDFRMVWMQKTYWKTYGGTLTHFWIAKFDFDWEFSVDAITWFSPIIVVITIRLHIVLNAKQDWESICRCSLTHFFLTHVQSSLGRKFVLRIVNMFASHNAASIVAILFSFQQVSDKKQTYGKYMTAHHVALTWHHHDISILPRVGRSVVVEVLIQQCSAVLDLLHRMTDEKNKKIPLKKLNRVTGNARNPSSLFSIPSSGGRTTEGLRSRRLFQGT